MYLRIISLIIMTFIVSCADMEDSAGDKGLDTVFAVYNYVKGKAQIKTIDGHINSKDVCLDLSKNNYMDLYVEAEGIYPNPPENIRNTKLEIDKIGVYFERKDKEEAPFIIEIPQNDMASFKGLAISYNGYNEDKIDFLKAYDKNFTHIKEDEKAVYKIVAIVRATEKPQGLAKPLTLEFAYNFGEINIAGSLKACAGM